MSITDIVNGDGRVCTRRFFRWSFQRSTDDDGRYLIINKHYMLTRACFSYPSRTVSSTLSGEGFSGWQQSCSRYAQVTSHVVWRETWLCLCNGTCTRSLNVRVANYSLQILQRHYTLLQCYLVRGAHNRKPKLLHSSRAASGPLRLKRKDGRDGRALHLRATCRIRHRQRCATDIPISSALGNG